MITEAILTKEKAVIPYVTAGLPDLDTTGEILKVLDEAGAAAIEIGIPFSDPMADGPVLQKASYAALQAGFSLDRLLSRLEKWSGSVRAPLIIMSYINPIMRRGIKETFSILREKGVQGLILPDMPLDGYELFTMCRDSGLDLIRLVAPTTPLERQKEVVSQCSGFVYAVTVKGVTGARSNLPAEIRRQVSDIKSFTDLPVCAGFGVSNADQVKDMLTFADGVIVGSWLMGRIMEAEKPVMAARQMFVELMGSKRI
ncbi:MAG: tryptophan synthase subunit alpha [Desulfomonilia bacterium]|jgi:tryptophan synthase alpha chain